MNWLIALGYVIGWLVAGVILTRVFLEGEEEGQRKRSQAQRIVYRHGELISEEVEIEPELNLSQRRSCGAEGFVVALGWPVVLVLAILWLTGWSIKWTLRALFDLSATRTPLFRTRRESAAEQRKATRARELAVQSELDAYRRLAAEYNLPAPDLAVPDA